MKGFKDLAVKEVNTGAAFEKMITSVVNNIVPPSLCT